MRKVLLIVGGILAVAAIAYVGLVIYTILFEDGGTA